ncbi:hypothetical protein LRS71_09430 [Rhodococcus pyridinivorans]|uniref:hypothetical protein n=1 Tax=Rhodococcus pyridinivorans TaxID=103816 RepID=UPI001E3685AD|nr:hypothetical protein [Rhodococcus pyridinivorans]MCD5419774.1 hypothetical protein [Rhodococcus pyridinivorans]
MPDDLFADFTLDGQRFKARGLPVETASELGYYRELIADVARRLWLRSNPDRTNAPTGFKAAFDLRMTEVKKGSSRPQLYLHRPDSVDEDDFNEWCVFYAKARDLVTHTIDTVSAHEILPTDFPPESVRHLRQMGRTLDDADRITVGRPKFQGRKASLTKSVRQTIKKIDAAIADNAEYTATGVIYAFDGSNRSFRVRVAEGTSTTCFIQRGRDDLLRTVKEYCAPDGITAPDVSVSGYIAADSEVSRQNLNDVYSIKIVYPLKAKQLQSKIEMLESLKDGWGGPSSKAPKKETLRFVASLFSDLTLARDDVNIASEHGGNLIIEWVRGDVEYTAVVDEHSMYLCADNTTTDELLEKDMKLNRSALEKLVQEGGWVD